MDQQDRESYEQADPEVMYAQGAVASGTFGNQAAGNRVTFQEER